MRRAFHAAGDGARLPTAAKTWNGLRTDGTPFELLMSDEAFAGVTALTSLHVNNNKLRWLPRSLELSRVSNLTVANNPWTCTCQLAPLRRWMDANSRRRTEAICASPPAQRGKPVRDSAAFAACRVKPKRTKMAARH
ncbi:chondroadherin-like isoform X2 [Phycodurus eques]|uniref:chondroadherin-like isoform X2 n=1 Tax=Phycodurus eques TaxID=693459 RepID=UPI002ACD47E0|nr:chondroadherin-like isoform X2 [Phycodurus eques]